MSLINCPDCGNKFPVTDLTCPKCDYYKDVQFSNINEFKVTQTHGITAFFSLSRAYDCVIEYHEVQNYLSKLSDRERINAVSESSRMFALDRQIYQLLSASVVLYQASMEAILSLAESFDEDLCVSGSFYEKWIDALDAYGASTKEFEKYNDEFYQELRIPLIHLHPHTEDRLNKINNMTFKKVYNGVRYGWWAYCRLLHGIGRIDSNYSESWERVCKPAGLAPTLFMDSHPNNLC